jgi:hypothetical protein
MKQKLALALLLCAPALHAATPPGSTQYQHINSTWSAPNTTYPVCSATVKTYCLSSYTLNNIDPYGNPSIITVPNGGIPAGGAVSYSWTPGGYLYCGAWTVSVTANYLDGTGSGVTSSTVSTTVQVSCPLTPSPVTGLSAAPAL